MSSTQKFLLAILPKSWAQGMEAESRAWMLKCPCGHAKSIWDWGGIRWKAAGNPKKYLRCTQCGEMTWHTCMKEAQQQRQG